jgi:hypothetical protein
MENVERLYSNVDRELLRILGRIAEKIRQFSLPDTISPRRCNAWPFVFPSNIPPTYKYPRLIQPPELTV